MEKNRKYRKIIGSCNWDRIDINEEFRSVHSDVIESIWKELKNSHARNIKRKE